MVGDPKWGCGRHCGSQTENGDLFPTSIISVSVSILCTDEQILDAKTQHNWLKDVVLAA